MGVLIGFGLLTENVEAQVVINIVNPTETLKTEAIDDLLFTVQYRMTFVVDTLHPEKSQQEMMILKAGAKSAVFYSYAKFMADSVIAADQANGVPPDVMIEHIKSYTSLVNYKIYKNYPAGKVTTLEQLAMSRFRCEEENERPDWELLPDTMTILSYPCRKAVCRFKGRDYEAWFTTAIPRSEGPWKLHGLPGLIMNAADSGREYVFECTGLVESRGKEAIQYGDSGYEPISRKNMEKLFERQAADPIGFIKASAPNVKVQVVNETGESIQPKNTPYNPIERAEK
jgi:GLPGLI family protein